MTTATDKTALPNSIAALHFVCSCFGIGDKELALTLERIRRNTKEPDKCFPRKLWRMTLARAEAGDEQWRDALLIIQREALYDRIRRQDGKPLFSFTGDLTEKLVSQTTFCYERLLPKLDTTGVSTTDLMWVLVEHFFVPIAFVHLVQNWQRGLGTEFQGEASWYLPMESKEGIKKPIPRVLDWWLRVAGCLTAYGISEKLGSESLRRNIDRWRTGKNIPPVASLHRLVEKFRDDVSWAGESDNWKARFTLACAMQNLCDSMDEHFKSLQKNPSLQLAKMFGRIEKEGILCDERRLLADTNTFFTARLLQLRLKREGKWEKDVLASTPSKDNQQEYEFPVLPGNHFLEFIKKRAVSDGRFKDDQTPIERYTALQEYIFDLGVEGLNHILDSKRK